MAQLEHNFSSALTTWKEVNLSELQKTLDAQGLEVVQHQKESVVGRKALSDRTKDFRKLPDDEKLGAFKVLLKAYQTEIDSLTKRCKTSENAFLNVYKVLAEAPDPYPLLDAAVDQTVKVEEARALEAEVQRLRDDNVDLRRRVGEVSSLEASKKKIQTRLDQVEEKMEDLIREKVTQKENELNATYDEKMRNYEERERDLQRQVTLAKNQLRDLQTSNESTQAKLLNHSERQDQEVVAKLAEMDFIVADLERANSRVAAVERRNEILRAEIEAVRSGSDSNDRVQSLETQISELESECARLSRSFETQKAAAHEAELTTKRKSDEATKELSSRTTEIDNLKQKLRNYSDYDEIKRELEIMKYVEFAGGDVDDLDDPHPSGLDLRLPDPNADKANSQQGRSLETLLAAKNKRILEELTKFRVLHGELEASLRSVSEDLANNKDELEKQKLLNEKLEIDLLQVNKHVNGAATGSAEKSDASTPPGSQQEGLAGLNIGQQNESQTRISPIPFTSSADTSILPIVTSQRDRFRQRNAELEEELRKQFQIISDLRTEVKSLQSDNLKLYEKVRYMQSYRDESKIVPSSSAMNALGATPASRPDEMGRYRARYEESMNPFEVFRGREAQRAVQALNPVERGTLVLTRHILGNRRSRNAFIAYAVGLHVLVIFTLYEFTTASGTTLQKQPPPGF
ncbi:CASP C terminal-domain-containing protein [Gautieria morchelliformis]|nr:CASP C terminal-domain-containing protein [Gautieria morchelliformis]